MLLISTFLDSTFIVNTHVHWPGWGDTVHAKVLEHGDEVGVMVAVSHPHQLAALIMMAAEPSLTPHFA